MRTIYKYDLDVVDRIGLLIPEGAQFLSAQVQNSIPRMWMLVDTEAARQQRYYRIYGTGHEIDPTIEIAFLGTFQLESGRLVFHIFQEVTAT